MNNPEAKGGSTPHEDQNRKERPPNNTPGSFFSGSKSISAPGDHMLLPAHPTPDREAASVLSQEPSLGAPVQHQQDAEERHTSLESEDGFILTPGTAMQYSQDPASAREDQGTQLVIEEFSEGVDQDIVSLGASEESAEFAELAVSNAASAPVVSLLEDGGSYSTSGGSFSTASEFSSAREFLEPSETEMPWGVAEAELAEEQPIQATADVDALSLHEPYAWDVFGGVGRNSMRLEGESMHSAEALNTDTSSEASEGASSEDGSFTTSGSSVFFESAEPSPCSGGHAACEDVERDKLERLRRVHDFAASVPGLCSGFLQDGLSPAAAEGCLDAEHSDGSTHSQVYCHSVHPALLRTGYVASLSWVSESKRSMVYQDSKDSIKRAQYRNEDMDRGQTNNDHYRDSNASQEFSPCWRLGISSHGRAGETRIFPTLDGSPRRENNSLGHPPLVGEQGERTQREPEDKEWSLTSCLCAFVTFSWWKLWK